MTTRLDNNLNFTKEKTNPLKQIWQVGAHKLIILDDEIVRKLDIRENQVFEQILKDENSILLKLKEF